MSIASLGMYDDPLIRSANDELWQVWRDSIARLSSRSIKPPATLNRDMPLAEQWAHKDLFLSQTCGFPYITKYRDQVRLVATPRYSHPGCDGHCYSSFVITRKNTSGSLLDYRDKTLAANSADSLSGLIALELMLGQSGINAPFFSQCLFSGAHLKSMRMVAANNADLCCIDAVTWALNCRLEPQLADELQIIAQTPSLPGLPLITGQGRNTIFVESLRQAISGSVSEASAADALGKLGITGFDIVDDHEYATILQHYALVPAGLRSALAKKYSNLNNS